MSRWLIENSRFVLAASIFVLCLAISWVIYDHFGYRLIEAMYKGESIDILNQLMTGRGVTPLERYYDAADKLMWDFSFASCTSFLIIMLFLGIGLTKTFLLLSSLLFFSFLLFSVLEMFPSLIKAIRLTGIDYYAAKDRYIPDHAVIYRMKPFFSRTFAYKGDQYSPVYGIEVPVMTIKWWNDEYGFRTHNGRATSDVVVIGDSYIAYGEDSSDLFGARLEQISGLSVSNLAVGGYGPYHYLELLKRHGIGKQASYALFSFFEGNDLRDISRYLEWKNGGDYGKNAVIAKTFLQRYLVVIQDIIGYVKETTGVLTQYLISYITNERIHPDLAVVRIDNSEYKNLFFYKNDTRPTEEIIKSVEWKELRKILGEFKGICLQNNIAPVVLYIPQAAHIYAQYTTDESGANWLRIRNRQIAAKMNIENAVTAIARELSIPLISLSPAFESAAKKGIMLYYPFDSHWNSEARQIGAAFVARILKKENGTESP